MRDMSKTKNKTNYKYILYLVCIIFLLFFLSIGIILFVKNYTGFFGPKVSEDDVIYKSDSNTVIIKNILSVEDQFGKTIMDDNGGSYGYLEFSVENTQDTKRNYQIYVTKNVVFQKEINSKYMRFYLTDDSDNALGVYQNGKLPSYVDLKFIKDSPNNKLIYSGTLEAKETQDFRLRVWISSNYIITNDEEVFSFKINARAV